MSKTTLFLNPVKQTGESGNYHQNTTYVDESYHNEWPALSLAIQVF